MTWLHGTVTLTVGQILLIAVTWCVTTIVMTFIGQVWKHLGPDAPRIAKHLPQIVMNRFNAWRGGYG